MGIVEDNRFARTNGRYALRMVDLETDVAIQAFGGGFGCESAFKLTSTLEELLGDVSAKLSDKVHSLLSTWQFEETFAKFDGFGDAPGNFSFRLTREGDK